MRTLKFKEVDLEQQVVSKIIQELDRIGRDREQVRHKNSLGLMYVLPIKKINELTFSGHLAGPVTSHSLRGFPLSVKFEVTQNPGGYEQISILSKDPDTTYEQAIELVKHGIFKHSRELPKKPYVFDEGMDKSNWDGYYLSYSGIDNNLWNNFDEVFNRAVEEEYFPENFRETCREYGFNIDPYPKNRGLTNIPSHFEQLV